MCYYNKISETNNGTVHFSPCGRQFIVNYNNLSFMQDYVDFVEFYNRIEDCYEKTRHKKARDIRDINFKTLVQCMVLRFSITEVRELHYLLQTALIEYNIHVQV